MLTGVILMDIQATLLEMEILNKQDFGDSETLEGLFIKLLSNLNFRTQKY